MNMLGTVAPVSSSPSVNDKDSLDMIKPFISVHKDLLSNSTKKDSIWDLNGFPTEFISIRKNPVLTKTGQRSDGAIAEKPIFVLIPGNPGIAHYYEEFIEHVHHYSGVDSFCVTYPGHAATVPIAQPLNVDQQIQHKIDFLDALYKRLLPKDTPILLAGHSLGGYVVLEILRRRPDLPIVQAYQLFPSLHCMADTPNGITMSKLLMPGVRHAASLFISTLRATLPTSFMKSVVAYQSDLEGNAFDVTFDRLISSDVAVTHTLYLGSDEMRVIRELDHDHVSKHIDKLVFYYGTKDDWAPPSHYQDMMRHHPTARIHMCEREIPHAFIKDHSHFMGLWVAEQIKAWFTTSANS